MSSAAAIRLWKEARALVVVWAAGLTVILLAREDAPILGAQITVLASIALGAWSFGHEFSHRTMPLLLAQPVSRRRQALEKFAVLLPMVATLVLASLGRRTPSWVLLLLAAAAGLTLAPWLTLCARSARAGLIFTIAALIAGVLGTELLANHLVHTGTGRVADVVRTIALRWVAPMALLAAAVAAWRQFTRLQVADDPAAHVGLFARWPGRTRSRAGPHRPRPWLALIGKELALQQSVFAVSGLAILVWLIDWRFNDPASHQAVTFAVVILHGPCVALLAGAIASAEERRLGTLAGQLVAPVAGSRQWLIKAGLAMVVATVLAVGLPHIVAAANPAVLSSRDWHWLFGPEWIGLTIGLVAAGLYVSSLSGNGLQALLVAIPFAYLLGLICETSIQMLVGRRTLLDAREFYPLSIAFGLLCAAGYLLLLLWLAGVNHRSAVHERRRVARQMAGLLLYPLLAGLLLRELLRIAVR